jgi:hypothetical protein
VIGEIIQHILDGGFLLRYTYRADGAHHFTICKLYEDKEVSASWIYTDIMVRSLSGAFVLLDVVKMHMKSVDEAITQRRLVESTLG